MKIRAFAPANISCVFKIHKHNSPRWMGSSGVGFTLNEGVVVEAVRANTTEVFFNNKKIYLPTVNSVIRALVQEEVKIDIRSPLPLGCGFGLSGASALATAYTLNELLGLKKSKKELAIIAHIAEVECKTGLGDVVSQYFGGMLAKLKPSSHFLVRRIPVDDLLVYCVYFSKLPTKSIITNSVLRDRINKSATIALKKLSYLLKTGKKIAFSDIIHFAKEFAIGSGLLRNKKVIETIKNVERHKGYASMIMLGNAVFADIPFTGAIRMRISDRKAHVL